LLVVNARRADVSDEPGRVVDVDAPGTSLRTQTAFFAQRQSPHGDIKNRRTKTRRCFISEFDPLVLPGAGGPTIEEYQRGTDAENARALEALPAFLREVSKFHELGELPKGVTTLPGAETVYVYVASRPGAPQRPPQITGGTGGASFKPVDGEQSDLLDLMQPKMPGQMYVLDRGGAQQVIVGEQIIRFQP
jgi:hypothetical protein